MKRNCQLPIERLQIVYPLTLKTNELVTLLASQTGKSATSTELQTRMEQLLKQLSDLEEEKRKTASEKEDLQQDLLKQKDRMVETEREVGYYPPSPQISETERAADSKPHSHL